MKEKERHAARLAVRQQAADREQDQEDPQKGEMPRARRQALMSAVDNKQPAAPAEKR